MDQRNEAIKKLVWQWLDQVVIGLNLCPFAKGPRDQGRIEVRVAQAQTLDLLVSEIGACFQLLQEQPQTELETLLLVVPELLVSFAQYNDFLEIADAALEKSSLEGVIQIASFHPGYQFANTSVDDVSNWTNRAPYPIFHFLREASVEQAVSSLSDPEEIYLRNIRRMESLTADERCRLFPWLFG
ncbi:MAG: DUF1415 domain-containing protein [Thiotrichales bacterium]